MLFVYVVYYVAYDLFINFVFTFISEQETQLQQRKRASILRCRKHFDMLNRFQGVCSSVSVSVEISLNKK